MSWCVMGKMIQKGVIFCGLILVSFLLIWVGNGSEDETGFMEEFILVGFCSFECLFSPWKL